MPKLTKRFVDQVEPETKDVTYWDDELRGLGLRVWPSGRKVYIATTRVKGRLRKVTIGPKIGTRKASDIERKDIAELHHTMREIPYQANRMLGVLSKMFNLAEVWGCAPTTPTLACM